MKIAITLAAVVVGQAFPASYNYTCLDVSQTKCSNIKIKYPAFQGVNYLFSNVSAFDAYFGGLTTDINAQLGQQCGIGSGTLDIAKTGYLGLFSNQLFNSSFNPYSSETPAKVCNGGQVVKVQPICRDACVQFISKDFPNSLKAQGCTNQTLLDEATIQSNIDRTCENFPTTDCTNQISASNVLTSGLVGLVAIIALIMM